MYNRYIPQSDGTFRRSTVQERPPQQQNQERTERKQNISVPQPPPSQAQNGSCPPPPPQRPEPRQKARGQRPASKPPCKFVEEPRETSAGVFLRNLLPRNLDTGDLLIIVLLLLMAGDSPEDQNNALLTLAIYLFL